MSVEPFNLRRRVCPAGISLPVTKSVTRLAGRRLELRTGSFSLSPAVLLAACGGGGGGGGPQPIQAPPPAVTGQSDSLAAPAGGSTLTGNVLANDTATGGAAPTVISVAVQGGSAGTVGQPLQGSLGQLTIQANGSFSYAIGANAPAFTALAAGQTASEVFTYTPSSGGTSGAAQTLTIMVTGVNDAPAAADDVGGASAVGSAPVTGNVLGNDSDPDNGAVLTVTGVRVGTGQLAQAIGAQAANTLPTVVGRYGTLSMQSDGSYSYIADITNADAKALAFGQTATETFTYTISDGSIATTATLSFTIVGTNDAPIVAADKTVNANALDGVVFSIPAPTDPDQGDELTVTIKTLPAPALGVVELADGTALVVGQIITLGDIALLRFRPAAVQSGGTTSFAYTVTDRSGASASQTLTINVPATPPGAREDAFALDLSAAGSLSANVLANDTGPTPTEISMSLLSNTGSTGASLGNGVNAAYGRFGVLTYDATGRITYRPYDGELAVGAGQTVVETFSQFVRYQPDQGSSALLEITIARPAEDVRSGTSSQDTLVAGLAGSVLDGGAGDDLLIGSRSNDVLNGGAGNDVLRAAPADCPALLGYAGRDQFNGGAGNDVIIGGTSTGDVAQFSGRRSSYRIDSTAAGVVVVDLNPSDGDDGTDMLTNVEYLQFSDVFYNVYPLTVDRPYFDDLAFTTHAVVANAPFSLTTSRFPVTVQGAPVPGADLVLTRADGSAAPTWLSFDPVSYSITGTPPAGSDGALDLVITLRENGLPIGYDSLRLFVYSPSPSDVQGTAAAETFAGSAGADRIFGQGGGDTFLGSPGGDLLVGSADGSFLAPATADYSLSNAAVTIDQALGTASGGYAEGDTLIRVTQIIGSNFNDVLIGGFLTTSLAGGGGDDVLMAGRFGSSFLRGGAGADTLISLFDDFGIADYSLSPGGVTLDSASGRGHGSDAEGDRLINIGRVVGSSFDDVLVGFDHATGGSGNDRLVASATGSTLIGGGGDDLLTGGDGDDDFQPGSGADSINGGGGRDRLDYSDASAGVTVDLSSGTASGGGGSDVFTGIEDVFGTSFADVLYGDDGANSLSGFSGADQLMGRGGNDRLQLTYTGSSLAAVDGGSGRDFLDVSGITVIDLASGVGRRNGSLVLTIAGVEDISATAQGGVELIGDAAANTLFATGNDTDDIVRGGGGDDRLIGGGGNDLLEGGSGADTLIGGYSDVQPYLSDGIDTAVYSGSALGVRVDLSTGTGAGGDAAGDKLYSIDRLVGSAHADLLVASGIAADQLDGAGGNDILIGRVASQSGVNGSQVTGVDMLVGGDGNDLLVRGNGQGGAGDDILVALNGVATTLAGGTGSDIFIVDTAHLGAVAPDFTLSIEDFTSGADRIDLSNLRDAQGNALDIADMLARASVQNGNTVLNIDPFLTAQGTGMSGTLTLVGFTGTLMAADFVFANGTDWEALVPAGASIA